VVEGQAKDCGQNAGHGHPEDVCNVVATALAEIVGCYLPYLWLKEGRTAWLLLPAALALALFAWLLTLHRSG